MSESKRSNKKKGNTPSKEEAALALSTIKSLQEKGDIESAEKKIREEEIAKQQILAEAEKIRILAAQEQVRRKLRENLKKKEEQKIKKGFTNFLESATIKESKIKWKSINGGNRLHGYVGEKLVFEINRGLTLFSLYIKDKNFLEEKKIPKSYIGCSTSILKLKHKSDKFI